MQELNTLVNNVMADMVKSGQIEEIIRAKVEKSVEDAFSSMFGTHGKFGKDIKKSLEENLNIDFKNSGLHEFSAVMVDAIKGAAHKHMKEAAQGRFLEDIEKILSPAPKEITVQELVTLYIEWWRQDTYDADTLDEHATVEIERGAGSLYDTYDLNIWKRRDHSHHLSKRSADVKIHIGKDKDIRIIWHGREHLGTIDYGADAKLFQMYAAKTVITDIDTADVDCLETELRTYGH